MLLPSLCFNRDSERDLDRRVCRSNAEWPQRAACLAEIFWKGLVVVAKSQKVFTHPKV